MLDKETAIDLRVIGPNWNPHKGAKRTGSNGTYVKRVVTRTAKTTYENAHVFIMKEIDVYVHDVKMETLRNVNVQVQDDGDEAVLGTEAIKKLKVVQPFKALKNSNTDDD